jgi:DUF971 family protein
MSQPTRIEPHSAREILIEWNSGEKFAVPYTELRFECPCAVCVDEHTGKRVIRRESIPADIRVLGANVVGRYAIQFNWSDRHSTGMYHFESLREICLRSGLRIA